MDEYREMSETLDYLLGDRNKAKVVLKDDWLAGLQKGLLGIQSGNPEIVYLVNKHEGVDRLSPLSFNGMRAGVCSIRFLAEVLTFHRIYALFSVEDIEHYRFKGYVEVNYKYLKKYHSLQDFITPNIQSEFNKDLV
jgi:hypothetical protein